MIRKRNSKWYYIILVKDAQGKTHRIERAGGDTKAECRLAEAKAILENSALDYNPSSDMSISAYMDYWLEKYVSTLSENTQKNYASTVKNHIKPAFKKRRLGSIKPMDIQEFIESKAHMSRGSQDGILRMLHGAFRYAVSPCGFIQHNPCDGIRLPKVSAPKRETTVFSEEELKIIFEKFTQEHDYYLPLQIMYHTGLRIGEALALSWEDAGIHAFFLSLVVETCYPILDCSMCRLLISRVILIAKCQRNIKIPVAFEISLDYRFKISFCPFCVEPFLFWGCLTVFSFSPEYMSTLRKIKITDLYKISLLIHS